MPAKVYFPRRPARPRKSTASASSSDSGAARGFDKLFAEGTAPRSRSTGASRGTPRILPSRSCGRALRPREEGARPFRHRHQQRSYADASRRAIANLRRPRRSTGLHDGDGRGADHRRRRAVWTTLVPVRVDGGTWEGGEDRRRDRPRHGRCSSSPHFQGAHALPVRRGAEEPRDGCAILGKQTLHSDVKPKVDVRGPHRRLDSRAALPGEVYRPTPTARRSSTLSRCIGCGECGRLSRRARSLANWRTAADRDPGKTAGVNALAAVHGKGRGRPALRQLPHRHTPIGDCCDWSDTPLTQGHRLPLSTDPVVIDQGERRPLQRRPRRPRRRPLAHASFRR